MSLLERHHLRVSSRPMRDGDRFAKFMAARVAGSHWVCVCVCGALESMTPIPHVHIYYICFTPREPRVMRVELCAPSVQQRAAIDYIAYIATFANRTHYGRGVYAYDGLDWRIIYRHTTQIVTVQLNLAANAYWFWNIRNMGYGLNCLRYNYENKFLYVYRKNMF